MVELSCMSNPSLFFKISLHVNHPHINCITMANRLSKFYYVCRATILVLKRALQFDGQFVSFMLLSY